MLNAIFICSILHVVFLSSCKKVTWIYAASIVALMKDAMALWNWAIVNMVRKSVRGSSDAFDVKSSVTMLSFGARPNPACAKLWLMFRNRAVFINLLPEFSFGWKFCIDAHNEKTTTQFGSNTRSKLAATKSNGGNCVLAFLKAVLKPVQLFQMEHNLINY